MDSEVSERAEPMQFTKEENLKEHKLEKKGIDDF